MGRNSKKNKGRKPVAEQGLKGATSLVSASTNVTTAPSRPARTAKHKVRKFPPQPMATSSAQAYNSPKVKSSQSLNEPQSILSSLPTDNLSQKVDNQEAVPSYTSATHCYESPPTATAILKESPEAGSTSTEREVELHQPISSDSYDTCSSSSSETEMGFKNDFHNIPKTDNAANILKIEQKRETEQTQRLNVWQQEDGKPKGVDADKFASISVVAMENKEVPQRAAGIGHCPQIAAVPDVKEPRTSLLTCLHDKLEVPGRLHVEAQADDTGISLNDSAIQENIPPQQVSHLKQELLLQTETSCGDRSTDPVIARKEQDFMDAEPVVNVQSTSWSETTVVDVSVTFCTSTDNLKQKYDQEERELADGSFNKGSNEDKNKTPAEEALPCSIQKSASPDVHQQVEANARELVIDILQHQERETSEQSNLDAVQALQTTDLTPSLQSEESRATKVVEQHTRVEVKQKHEPEELNRAERGTVEDEMQITDQDLQSVITEKKHSIMSIQDTVLVSPAESIHEAQKNLQERNLSTSLNDSGEAQETNEEKSSASQIHERQEVAAQSVVPEEVTTFEKPNLLDPEQNIKELEEPETCSIPINTQTEWQGKPDEAVGSVNGVHTTNSVENGVEKLATSETEAEDLTPEKNKEYQDEKTHHLDGGISIVFEGHATCSVETEVKKLEVVELEVHSIMLGKEQCQEEEVDEVYSGSVSEEHKTRDSLVDQMEKPRVGEPQAESVPLDKDWEYQEEKTEQVYNESVCKEDPRSLENAVKKLDAEKSEEATVVAQDKEFEEKPGQLDDIRSCVEKKPKVVETKLVIATLEEEDELQDEMPDQVDSGHVCKEDETSSVEKQPENESDRDNLELHREKENQEEKNDTGAECEGHARGSVESEMEKLQVGEPEVKDFTLDKEDYLQEQPDHTHGGCVSQDHIITKSLEKGSEDPDVEEPWVEGVTLHKYEECHKDEPDQQFDRGLVVNELNSVKSELEKNELGHPEEGIVLQKNECPQGKSDHAHCGSICQEAKTAVSIENVMKDKVGEPQVGGDKDQECQEDKTTDFLENAMEFNMRKPPQVGGAKDQESHEEKSDQQLDLGTAFEKHSTNSIENKMEELEVREPEADVIKLNTEECHGQENQQVHRGSVYEDNRTRDTLENVQNPDSHAADVTLDKDQVYQEENPDKVDCDSVSQKHTQSSVEHDTEKLEVEEVEIASAVNQERDCQEEDIINSVADEAEQSESEVESATLEEKKESPEEIPNQVDSGYACEEHEMHSMANQPEKPELEEPEVEGVALHKDKESQEDDLDQLEREALCEGHGKNSEMEKVEAEKVEAALDKEECDEERYHEVDVPSVCEKHPETDLLEHARENPNVGDPQVEHVMLDKNLGLQEKLSDQVDSEYVCEEHPPVDNEAEKLEVEELKYGIAVEERECPKEDIEKTVEIGMEQSKPEVESAATEENKESLDQMPDQIHGGYECNEHEMETVKNELEKPEVGEPEVEGGALHKVKERRLDKPIIHEGYVKTGVECEKEGEELEVALSKEESKEQKHHDADGDFLYEESQQQTDLLEHSMEKPGMEEPQVEGAMLDKDQESPEAEAEPDRVSSESVCQEHSASSTENERCQLEDVELEKATTIEEVEECLGEDPTKSVENGIEADCATLEEKKDGPEGLVNIKNEQAKPEEGEAEVESVTLHKKKDRQEEDDLGQLERGTICEGDAENYLESQMEKLEVGMPELDKKESEEEKHHQLNKGSNREDHQVANILEHATEKPDVEQPQVEGATLEKDLKLQEEIPDQVCCDSVSQEEQTSSVENEIEQLEVGDSEQAITNKEDKDSHGKLTTKTVDNEMEQPKLEEKSAGHLQEKKDSPEGMPDQTDSGREHKEDEKHLVEKLEVGEPEVANVPIHDKKESHKDTLDPLECTKSSVETDMEKLEVKKPEVNTTALDEEESEEGKHDQADGGAVCKEHQATDSPDAKEPQMEGVTLDKDQESPEDIADQVDDSDFARQEQSASSKESAKEKLEMGASQLAIAIEDDKECKEEDTLNSVDNEKEQPKLEVKSATLGEKKESSEQMPKTWSAEPEQVFSDSVCDHIRSAGNEIEKLAVGESKDATAVDEEKEYQEQKPSHLSCVDRTPEVEEPKVESSALEEQKELKEEMPYQVDSGYVCKEDDTNSTGDQQEKEPQVDNVAFHEEQESQEDKPGLRDRGTGCEGHSTNSNEIEMEVGEPEVKHITLNKEDNLQEPLGQADATNTVESETEKLQVGEPEVKDTTLNTEGRSVSEEHQVTDFSEHAMEKPDVEEPQVKGATLDKDQESPEEKLNQVDSDAACKEIPESSLRSKIEKLEVGEREYQEESPCQFNVCKEYDIEIVSEKPEIKEPEVQNATLEEKKECQEQKNNEVESDSVCNEHEAESVEVPKVKHPELESDSVCNEHQAESVEVSEVKDPELKSVALHQIESNKNKAEEVECCSDEQLITGSVQKDLEKLEVGETRGLAIEEAERQPDHADEASCVSEEQAPKSVASDLEKLELRESEASDLETPKVEEADVDGSEIEKLEVGEREYQEESPCQFNVCEQYDTVNVLENPEIKEPAEVYSATLEENKECQEDKSDQVEGDSVYKELQTESVDVSKVKDPEPQSGAIHQIESYENKAEEVSCCPDEQLITTQSLTVEEKEECEPDHADHASCAWEEQSPKSVVSDLEKRELGQPEAGAMPDKVQYQEEQPSQVRSSSLSDAHTTNLLENELENSKLEEPEVDGVKLDEETQCQEQNHANVESTHQNLRTSLECAMVEHLNLEEPGSAGATLDTADSQEEEPCQLHTEPICEEKKVHSLESEMEELEEGEPEGSVKLDKKDAYQEQKPAVNEKASEENEQTTSSLGGEKEKLDVPKITLEGHQDEEPGELGSGSACEEPNVGKQEPDSAALKENKECQPDDVHSGCGYEGQATKSKEAEVDTEGVKFDKMQASHEDKPDQVHNSSARGQQPADEMIEVEVGELKGSVKLDELDGYHEQKPADNVNVAEDNEQTTSSLESDKEKLEVEDPKVTLEEHQNEEPGQLGIGSACEEPDMGKQEVVSAAPKEREECQKEGPDHVDSGCGYEEQATKSVEAELDTEGVTLDKMQALHEDKPDQIVNSSACGQQLADEMKELEVGELEGSVNLDEKDVYQEQKLADTVNVSSEEDERTTSSLKKIKEKLEVEDPKVTFEEHQDNEPGQLGECEEPNVGKQEVDCVALEEKEERQKEGPDHVDCGCGYEERVIKSGEAELERASDTEGVTLDKMQVSHEVKIDQIDNSSACGQQPAVAVEHEMGKLEVGEPQEQYPGNKESQKDDSDQLSSSYSIKSVKDMENLDVGVSDTQSVVPGKNTEYEERNLASGSVYEEQTSDFVDKVANKSEVRVPEVGDIMQGQKESQGQMPDQMISTYKTDFGEHDMDKFAAKQPELGDNVALEECQEKITDQADMRSACETKKPGLAVPLEKEKECQGGKPDQVDSTRYVNEARTVDFVANETEKPKVEVLKVQDDVLDKKECHGEKPDQDEKSSVHEELAGDFLEDEMVKPEVNQPDIGKPDQFLANSTSASHSLENETEKPEVEELEVQENVLDKVCNSEKTDPDVSSSVYDEHATDSKKDNKDDLEAHQPKDQVVACAALVHEAHTLDSLKNGTEMPRVGEPEVKEDVLDQECHSERPDQDETSSVFVEHAAGSKEDVKDELEVNQPEIGKPDRVVVTSTSESEADMLDSLESETEKTEKVPELEDNVLEQQECLGEKPDQEENSFVCEGHAANSQKTDKEELEVNQPEGGKPDQVVTDCTSVSEVHTLDSLMDETGKPEERVPETEVKALEQKECLDEKHDQDESGTVCDEYGTDSKEADLDKLEVNQPDQVMTSSTTISEAHTLDSMENETDKPEDEVQQVVDNVPEKKECLREKSEEAAKSSVSAEHATNSKNYNNELEVNQLEEGEPEQVVTDGICKSEARTLDSMENETEKPMENETEKAEGVPEVEDDVLEQEECHGEKPDQDESSSVCEEHATSFKKDTMGNVEVNQPKVGEPDQVIPGSTSLSKHTLHFLENETAKPEVRVPEVEDDGLASRKFPATQEGTLASADGCLKTKEEQEAQTVNFPVALSQENRAIESGLPSMAQDAEQRSLHAFSVGTWQDQDLRDVPAEGETEEVGFQETNLMSHAPKHQEGQQELLGQFDTAKPAEAKQEPMHHLKSKEEDQELHLTDVPATLASAELQAQEAIPVDEGGLDLSSIHTNPSNVKEMCMDIKQHEDGAEEQHSPHSVLQKQESSAEDVVKYGIHAVAAPNSELSSNKDVQLKDTEQNNANEKQLKQEKTSATLEELKGDFCLEEPAPICIPLHQSDVMIIATKTEPAKIDLDEAFLSLATPGIACSSPSNFLTLPL